MLLFRSPNQLLALSADAFFASLALALAFSLRLGEPIPPMGDFKALYLLAPVAALPVLAYLGVYRIVVRHMSVRDLRKIVQGYLIAALMLLAFAFILRIGGFPRSVPAMFFILGSVFSGGFRFAVSHYFQSRYGDLPEGPPLIIYGAGYEGVQLATLLAQSGGHVVSAFIDERPQLNNRFISGARVYAPESLSEVITLTRAEVIAVALDGDDREHRRCVLDSLTAYEIQVVMAADITPGPFLPGRQLLRELDVADLLERPEASIDLDGLHQELQDKTVMVTGAGGSIGSEVCRQLVLCGVGRLLLVEHSEYALWAIHKELSDQTAVVNHHGPELVPVLADIVDEPYLQQRLKGEQVDSIYHAAAYKHVNILERNVFAATRNNVLGTLAAARLGSALGVKRFILVSTDKAVSPTSVLGVTKLLAESAVRMVFTQSENCRVAIVRFGNVLGSSGSVIPVFEEQLENGKPLTITDPEATRFLMTIPEAARLILQASYLETHFGTYVLDMGEPVNIEALARKLARLKGLDEQTDSNLHIRYTGLKPGEKLHEELLVAGEFVDTAHDQIKRVDAADDPGLMQRADLLRQLEETLRARDESAIHVLLVQELDLIAKNVATLRAAH